MNRLANRMGLIASSLAVALCCAPSRGEYTITQYLNIQAASRPCVHPGGQEVLYLTNITGVAQVWRMPTYGGYQQPVTFDTNGVEGVSWSPEDPNLIIVSAAVGGNERSQLYATSPYGSPWTRLTPDDNAVHQFGAWARDGSCFAFSSNARNQRDFDVFEYDLQHGQTAVLYRAEGKNDAADYSPDQRYLLIERTLSSASSDLYLYDRTTGQVRRLTAHEGDVRFTDPRWDAEGTGFYLLCDQGREYLGLAYWPLDSSSFRWVETPPWDVEQFTISRDGSLLAWTTNDGGFSRFHLRHLHSGREVGPTRVPAGVIADMTFSRDGTRLLFTFGAGNRPYDVWLYEPHADKLRQITFSATGGIASSSLRAPELVEYPTFDGRSIPAFWYTPSEIRGRMPVIVSIHGGPEGQARPDMSGLYQFFLSRGWAILEPNIRGSTGYGKTYQALDNVRLRLDAVKDIEAAAQWLSARADVDSEKLVVHGGSYGGYMVLASLTEYSDTWAAGVCVVGITNFVTFLERTAPYRRSLREAEYGNLTTDREFLTEISPLTRVDNIKAPLLLIHGANDPRVPQHEADQIAAALRERGRVVEYLLFPDEGHGLRKTKNRIAAYSNMAEFLERHVTSK